MSEEDFRTWTKDLDGKPPELFRLLVEDEDLHREILELCRFDYFVHVEEDIPLVATLFARIDEALQTYLHELQRRKTTSDHGENSFHRSTVRKNIQNLHAASSKFLNALTNLTPAAIEHLEEQPDVVPDTISELLQSGAVSETVKREYEGIEDKSSRDAVEVLLDAFPTLSDGEANAKPTAKNKLLRRIAFPLLNQREDGEYALDAPMLVDPTTELVKLRVEIAALNVLLEIAGESLESSKFRPRSAYLKSDLVQSLKETFLKSQVVVAEQCPTWLIADPLEAGYHKKWSELSGDIKGEVIRQWNHRIEENLVPFISLIMKVDSIDGPLVKQGAIKDTYLDSKTGFEFPEKGFEVPFTEEDGPDVALKARQRNPKGNAGMSGDLWSHRKAFMQTERLFIWMALLAEFDGPLEDSLAPW